MHVSWASMQECAWYRTWRKRLPPHAAAMVLLMSCSAGKVLQPGHHSHRNITAAHVAQNPLLGNGRVACITLCICQTETQQSTDTGVTPAAAGEPTRRRMLEALKPPPPPSSLLPPPLLLHSCLKLQLHCMGPCYAIGKCQVMCTRVTGEDRPLCIQMTLHVVSCLLRT